LNVNDFRGNPLIFAVLLLIVVVNRKLDSVFLAPKISRQRCIFNEVRLQLDLINHILKIRRPLTVLELKRGSVVSLISS
jgi:hypothetical protein